MTLREQIEQLAARYGIALQDFAEHDEDPYFVFDQTSHPSPKGWVYVDRSLDGFFHGGPSQER